MHGMAILIMWRDSRVCLCTQILEGIATVLVGVLALLVLVDFPATAKFLTPEEKAYVIWKKSAFFVLRSHLLSSQKYCLGGSQSTTTLASARKRASHFVICGQP